MKNLRLTSALTLFPMKKRSFDLTSSWSQTHTWASILGASVAVTAAFCSANFLLMAPRKVRFLNIKSTNLTEQRRAALPAERWISDITPLLLISENGVVFGSVADVLAPIKRNAFSVMTLENWKEKVAAEVENWSQAKVEKQKFPIKTLIVSYKVDTISSPTLEVLKDVALIFSLLNKKHGFNASPSLVMADPADGQTRH
jgi:hypothetical protein